MSVGYFKGKKLSEEHKKKISDSLTNNPLVKGRAAWNKGKKMPHYSGEKHWNWQGGKTSEQETVRKSVEYKNWRRAVFQRDSYTCVLCGDNRGGNLEADHIQRWSDYPELRLVIDNGRTLCNPCHRKTPSYLDNQGRNMYSKLNGLAR